MQSATKADPSAPSASQTDVRFGKTEPPACRPEAENSAVTRSAGRKSSPLVLVRFACAVTLIAVSLWALLLPPLFPYSSHAVVNTKVITIKAKEPGRLESLALARLDPVADGQEIARIARDADSLQRERQEADFTRQKIQVRLDSLDAVIRVETGRLDALRAELEKSRGGLDRLQAQARRDSEDKVRLLKSELTERRATEARVEPLYKEGIVTGAQWSRTRAETLDSERALREAEAQLAVLTEGLAGGADPAREALEGYATRMLGLEREIGGLNLQRIDLAAQLAEIDQRIASLSARQNENPGYTLATPVSGLVWRQLAVPGEIVAEGQPLAQIADDSALFVEAYFRRDFLNSISVGDRANIYLIGGGRYVAGHVTEVQAQERANREPDIINTAPLDPSMLRVRIALDPDVADGAPLGALAKVLITSGKPSVVERTLLRLSLILRSHQ